MGRFLLPAIALALLYYAWRHPRGLAGLGEMVRPLLLLGLALLYLRSPIDIIPDTTVIGFIDDLVVLLAALYFGWGSPAESGDNQSEAQTPSRDGSAGFDPYEVLEVPRGASQEQVTRAFREKMKQYHPDRVADLGDDLKKVAHEKSVEIQRAYEVLKKN